MGDRRLEQLSPTQRAELCRQVCEHLSELVEGGAPADLQRRVEELLGDCAPYLALRNTFAATLELARECGQREDEERIDDVRFERCVEAARRRLGAESDD